MELLFESTDAFEQDLALLPKADRRRLIEAINSQCPFLTCEKETFFSKVYQPHTIRLSRNCCSSLYVMPADPGHAIILTIDDDPIFDQTIITLLRIVPSHAITEAYIETARSLYCHHMSETNAGDGADG